jgi:uncharacterized protein YjhX (UPF0386 family)
MHRKGFDQSDRSTPLYSKTLANFKSLLLIASQAGSGYKIPQIGEWPVRKYTKNRSGGFDW